MTFGPQFLDDVVQTVLVYGTDAFGRYLKGDPFIFLRQEIAFRLQVRQESPFGFYIGMRNRISRYGHFTGDLAYSGHDEIFGRQRS
jgi:hypothetical protein